MLPHNGSWFDCSWSNPVKIKVKSISINLNRLVPVFWSSVSINLDHLFCPDMKTILSPIKETIDDQRDLSCRICMQQLIPSNADYLTYKMQNVDFHRISWLEKPLFANALEHHVRDCNDNLKAPQEIWRCIVSTIHYILHFTLHYIFVWKSSSNSYNWISLNASLSRLLKLIFRFREHFNKLLICKSSYEEPFLVSSSWPTLCIWLHLYFVVFDT